MEDRDPNTQEVAWRTYTSVTMRGLVTSLPPTTASSRILLRMAVEPMKRSGCDATRDRRGRRDGQLHDQGLDPRLRTDTKKSSPLGCSEPDGEKTMGL